MFEVELYCEKVLKSRLIVKGQVNKVLIEGDKLKLRELMLIDCGNDFDCLVYRICLILIKVYEEAPLGSSAMKEYLKYYDWLKKSGFDKALLFDSVIIKWYEKEIKACEKIEEIILWLEYCEQLQDLYQLNIHPIKISAFYPVIKYIWQQMNLATSLNDIELTCKYLKNIQIFQDFKVIDDQIVSLIYKNIYRSINIEYDIEGTQKIFGKIVMGDLDKAFRVLKELKQIKLCENDFKCFKRLVKKISFKNVDKLCLVAGGKNQAVLEDFRELEAEKILFFESTEQVEVRVYLAQHPNIGNLVVKEYKAKKNSYDLSIHLKEIEILQKLSSLASDNNCFSLYFGYIYSGNSLYILTEYCEFNLMSTISDYKHQKKSLSEDKLLTTTKKLINSFTIMKALKIFHGSIKPQIFLVTPEFDLKITDFSAKSIKNRINAFWHTSKSNIQNTTGYEAPELYQQHINLAEFNTYKADVFSLGLTILQLATKENLSLLNKPGNHPLLLQKINSITFPWLKTLLSSMLDLNPKTRESFEFLLLSITSSTSIIN